METLRKMQIFGTILVLAVLALITYKIYRFWNCMDWPDDFIKPDAKADALCKFLGQPMTITMLIFHATEICLLLLFLYGTWKGNHKWLLGWIAMHFCCIIHNLAFTIHSDTPRKWTSAVFLTPHIVFWLCGLYIYIYMTLSRFDAASSFA